MAFQTPGLPNFNHGNSEDFDYDTERKLNNQLAKCKGDTRKMRKVLGKYKSKMSNTILNAYNSTIDDIEAGKEIDNEYKNPDSDFLSSDLPD